MLAHATLSVRHYEPGQMDLVHDWNQIVLPIEGTQDVDFGHTEGTIAAERGVLVPQGQPHLIRTRGRNRFIIVDIPCPTNCAWLMPQDIWRNATAEPFFNLDSGLRHLVGYVAHDLTNEALGTTTATHMAGLVIDALTSRLRRSWKSAAICRTLELIHTRYAESLTVSDLAAAAGLSPTTFNEHFRTAVGRTPRNYFIRVRLDHAARLLRACDLSIAEIALATGFSDQSALTRSMRRQLGITPAHIREKARQPTGSFRQKSFD